MSQVGDGTILGAGWIRTAASADTVGTACTVGS
jgi:hypothetical protein